MILLFCTNVHASYDCNELIGLIEIKKVSSVGYLDNWCSFQKSVGKFRKRFISMHGKEAWDKYSLLKDDPNEYGGIKISNFDLDLDEVVSFGRVLNSSNIPLTINNIEINDLYEFKVSKGKWYLDLSIEHNLENEYADTSGYYKGLEISHIALDKNKKPSEVMASFHRYITSPMVSDIWKKSHNKALK